MSGTKEGGIKARNTNYEKNGKDFYKRIGSLGGRVSGIKKGFALNPELASKAGKKGGRIGGRISKRGKARK